MYSLIVYFLNNVIRGGYTLLNSIVFNVDDNRSSKFMKISRNRLINGVLFVLGLISFNVQALEVTYTESQEDISNPDRGFYYPYTTLASNFLPLNESELVSRRTVPYTPFQGNYTVKSTIGLRHYVLDSYRGVDTIPSTFLTNIQTDFDTARVAGVRLIVRFSYNTSPTVGDCAVGFICPPYGDAPKERVLAHIAQLAGVLQNNSDVIVGLQQGFIGMWGESYYSDFFGDASPNAEPFLGRLTNQNWLDRNDVIDGLLEAVPINRMLQLRHPQAKQRFLNGSTAPLNTPPLGQGSAFNQSNEARLGLHNDCFLASADDFGTFTDYGNDSGIFTPNATALLKDYAEADSVYTLVGGESCADTLYSTQNNCAVNANGSIGAVAEMENNHYSYLNSDYNNEVNNDWQDGLCLDDIKRRLGYRLVLEKLTTQNATATNGSLDLTLSITNKGFAAAVNPRELWLVLRSQTTQEEYSYLLDGTNTNPQHWLAGHDYEVTAKPVLNAIAPGRYSMWLHIADASDNKRVFGRPEFSVQLANEGMWDSSTGYNNLNHIIEVSDEEFDLLNFIPTLLSTLKNRAKE